MLFLIYNPNGQWSGSIEVTNVKLFSVLKTEITTTLHLLFNKNRFVVIECCRRAIAIENYLVKSGSDLLEQKRRGRI